MAVRRTPEGLNDYEGLGHDLEQGQPPSLAELFGAVKEPTSDEGVNMTGGLLGPPPVRENPSGGNTSTGREMFDHAPTTTGLPQGMTVQGDESDGAGYGGGGQSAFSTPMMPHEPSPISGMPSNPEVTQRVSSPGATSALFSDASGGTPMFGRAGGLMGGGRGAPSMDAGGQSTPTQNMLALLRMMRNGG